MYKFMLDFTYMSAHRMDMQKKKEKDKNKKVVVCEPQTIYKQSSIARHIHATKRSVKFDP